MSWWSTRSTGSPTRSLADLAKIVEIFDAKGVSFVSVTQQFNTTTSMGGLTLNVLSSFTQFEREVASERVHGKITASKKKGMWMGGVPPLGYAIGDRKLIVVEPEAENVRHVFRRYAALGSVRLLQQELAARGITGKSWTSAAGRCWGVKPIGRSALYRILHNRLYRGEIVHNKSSLSRRAPNDHRPGARDAVHARLAQNVVERTGIRRKKPKRMTPTHAVENGKRYRY
jgi:site-specific DNA recombinase